MGMTSKIEQRLVSELRLREDDPHKHPAEQLQKLRASLREFGFVAPVLISADGTVWAGQGRILAALAEGIQTAPCVLIEHLSPEQLQAYALADNRLAESAAWDRALLSSELVRLQDMGLDITLTGFDAGDILTTPPEVSEDDFDVTPPEEATTRQGQLWKLGRHRLLCGDATRPDDVRRACPEGAALLLTDPPYNVDYTGGTSRRLKIANDRQSSDDFLRFLCGAFSAARAVMSAGAPYYIFYPQGPEQLNFLLALREAELPVHQTLIWCKNQLVLGRSDYQNQHEPILSGEAAEHEQCVYGWIKGAAHPWLSDRKQTTLLHFDKPTRSAEHPTMKPVKLAAYLMQNSLAPGGVALDPFGGSGTTLIAAEQLGDACRMLELEPRYCDVIIRRWEALTGERAVLMDA